MFVSRMNSEGLGPVDCEDDRKVPQINAIATDYDLRVDFEHFGRILVTSLQTSTEIGIALWKESSSGGGHWALYVNALRVPSARRALAV